MTETDNSSLLQQLQKIAYEAGKAILEVYESDDFSVETKDEDGYKSPLTRADKAANDVIIMGLEAISDLPIVSEENSTRDVDQHFGWSIR